MTYARYSKSAMILHWLLAFCLAFQLALGWRLEDLKGIEQFTGYQLHKSVGITILLLSLLRLALRLFRRLPEALADRGWAGALARAVHWGFYVVMIAGPLTGWLLVSTAKINVPTRVYGLVPWPHLPVPRAWHETAETLHGGLAILALVLFGLHILGALRHQFIKREQLLPRMIPVPGGRMSMPIAAVAVAVALAAMFAVSSLGWFMPLRGAPVAETPAPPQPVPPSSSPPVDEPADVPQVAATNMSEPAPAEAAASDWKIRPGGRLGFVAHWNETPVKGSFSRWDADVRFGPDALDQSNIVVTIDLSSVDSADAQRDEMLRGGDFFDVASHAKARYTARRVRNLGGDRYRADGELQLHGVDRRVPVTFNLEIKGDVATVRGSASFARSAFGVGSGEWAATDTIADPVTIDFAFKADRKKAE